MVQKSISKSLLLSGLSTIILLIMLGSVQDGSMAIKGISGSLLSALIFVLFLLFSYVNLIARFKKTEFGDYGIEVKGAEVFVQKNKGLHRFSNNTFVLSPISFEDPIEKNILLSTKTKDQKEFQIGISLITFHIPKENNTEVERYIKKHLHLQKKEWEGIDYIEERTNEILPAIQKELEAKISELPYKNIHAALPTIFENTRKEWEEKYAFSIRIKAYYY